jgi:hypothetical protein
MDISHERIIELTRQHRLRLQRDNEIHFANNKPGVGQDYYDFIEGLDSKCDHIRSDHRYGYQNTEIEASLKLVLNSVDIKIDKSSSEYSLLVDKFLGVAVETCYELLSMYKGEFDIKLDSTKLTTGKPPVKHRPKTVEIQKEVNRIAKDIFDKHPKTRIGIANLAEEIAAQLITEKKTHNPPGFEAIRKNYLGKYPNF